MRLNVFGLLHLNDAESSAENISVKDFQDQVLIYLNNALVLALSLKTQGIAFTLLTNKKSVIDKYLFDKRIELKVEQIPFSTSVPSGIKFYSAHFKFDVFRYFASLKIDYIAFCDLDVVCINNYPSCLDNFIKAKIPIFYDISDQVIPAYGHNIIIRDLELLHGLSSEGRWAGGEYISGSPEFFKALIVEIDCIYSNS